MRQTNLSVRLTLVTPELAKNYLRFNVNNRGLKKSHITFLSNQIKKDAFVENGECIVFDKNGVLRDGQHRLTAISINNRSYFIPVVSGVEPDCMATYDTGKGRSSADILKLNGFKYSGALAGFIQTINKYCVRNSKAIRSSSSGKSDVNVKVLTPATSSLITYIIGGENPSNEVYEFMKHLTGLSRTESSSTAYLYNKLYNSKINKEPLNSYWLLGMAIKSWNFYADGNPAIKYFKFDISKELPTPIKYIH